MAADTTKIKVVFKNELMLVIDKPAGMVVTNENRKKGVGSVEDWMAAEYPNGLMREGIVHRLDKGTSGLLVIAREKKALDFLKQQFKQRLVKKHYIALISGDLPVNGRIDMPINRSKYGFGKFKVHEDGKKAVTEFETIKKINIEGKIFTLVKINLLTGRTHQIRVHLSYLGWPLAGDVTYGGKKTAGLERPFLHAAELSIANPKDGEIMNFKADLPEDLNSILTGND